jgi:CubicO group peptidase (beta-lactamase class C family)
MIHKKNTDYPLKKHVKKLLEKGVFEGVFPCGAAGISIGSGHKRKRTITFHGKASLHPNKRDLSKETFFDLASLTKPLATTMAILSLIKEKKIDKDEKLPTLLGQKLKGDKNNITLNQLLGHSSGFPAHRDYFKKLKEIPGYKRGELVESLLLQERLEYKPGTKTVYSDLGFMLLGRIVEKKSGNPLELFVKKSVFQPLGLEEEIFYNPLTNKQNIPEWCFAATENCPWRKKVLFGEVHDDNCYSMGGVAGHSGLFGNIESVTSWAEFVLDAWKGVTSHPNIENRDLINFLVRQDDSSDNNRALGFDRPAKINPSSGRYLSDKSVGHLGFSGTSFWIDPEKELVVVLLTNRIHPSRENIKIKEFRPFFHNRVLEKLFENEK